MIESEELTLNRFHWLWGDVWIEMSDRQVNVDGVESSRESQVIEGWVRGALGCAPPEAPSRNEALISLAASTVACWWPMDRSFSKNYPLSKEAA